jgi:hypothetical protein
MSSIGDKFGRFEGILVGSNGFGMELVEDRLAGSSDEDEDCS